MTTAPTNGIGVRVAAAVAVSLSAAAALVYTLARLGLDPPMWLIDLLFWAPPLLGVAWVVVRHRSADAPGSNEAVPPRRPPSKVVLLVLPFAALAPGVIALAANPRVQMSFHGYLHSAYVYEVLNGPLPPDNPLLAGEPPNDYWLFHALVAAVVHVARLAPPLAAALVNLAALAAAPMLIGWILELLRLWPRRAAGRGLMALVALFALNLFGAVHVLVNAGGGRTGAGDVMNLDEMLLSGAARSAGLFAKFLNFNGFPLAVAFFLIALGCGVMLTRRVSFAATAGFFGGAVAALAFHPTTGVFALSVLPPSLILAWLVTRARPAWELTAKQGIALGLFAVGGLVAVGHYVVSAASALEEATEFGVFSADNIARFFGVTYPVLPLFVLGAVAAVRRRRSDLVMLVCVGVLGGLLATGTVLPGGNQYKFDYLTTFALALVAVAGWWSLRKAARPAWIAVAIAASAAVVAAQLYIGFAYLGSDFASDDSLAYAGVDVVPRGSAERGRAWRWIHANTATDAVVVVPLMNKDRARFLAIAQRPAYALVGGPFTAGNPEFARRAEIVRTLYAGDASDEARIEASAVIARDVEPAEVILAATSRRQAEALSVLDAERVFDGGDVVLYRLTAG